MPFCRGYTSSETPESSAARLAPKSMLSGKPRGHCIRGCGTYFPHKRGATGSRSKGDKPFHVCVGNKTGSNSLLKRNPVRFRRAEASRGPDRKAPGMRPLIVTDKGVIAAAWAKVKEKASRQMGRHALRRHAGESDEAAMRAAADALKQEVRRHHSPSAAARRGLAKAVA